MKLSRWTDRERWQSSHLIRCGWLDINNIFFFEMRKAILWNSWERGQRVAFKNRIEMFVKPLSATRSVQWHERSTFPHGIVPSLWKLTGVGFYHHVIAEMSSFTMADEDPDSLETAFSLTEWHRSYILQKTIGHANVWEKCYFLKTMKRVWNAGGEISIIWQTQGLDMGTGTPVL